MDAASVLEQQTQSMSNIPDEIKYLLREMREKDMQLYETRHKLQQRDAQLQKYLKQNGSLAKHPREQQLYTKIDEGFEQCKQLQADKCLMANTALFLLSKHLASLEKDIVKLEESGETPKILGVGPDLGSVDPDSIAALSNSMMESSLSISRSPSPGRKRGGRRSRSRRSMSVSSMESSSYGEESLPGTPRETSLTRTGRRKLERGASGTVTIPKRASNEDDELYCFCRQVSYGEMIACDNQNCRYEWFHYGCVGLTEPPKGIWYCPDCRKQMELDRKRKRRT